jgi:hypothetical protein
VCLMTFLVICATHPSCCRWWLLCRRALPETIRVLGWTDFPKPDFNARCAPPEIAGCALTASAACTA